ncbi:phosphotransferase family protein [Undibacterium cyanobacteriorum]|uniref:Phosphotransferase family protein n=1 Tax=Undibacterium cyanobacteriorum TaxID=3073561 RepID=A0ABY9RFY1_9BURK|nr:phosphotransferase family protein [Undibacterium sp. 20NA77.5]WMW80133.1 phosphotransferase family protein [Undibacterium sp. 20NA77.5]
MSDFNDRAGQVRSGEELPMAAIEHFIKQHLPDLQGQAELEQFSGGASNLTYLLRFPDRDLILRRPPFGHKAKSAHDMLREAKIMQALKPVYPYVPTVIAACDDASVMDCDFYVMERIHGIIPRHNLPKGLVLSEAETRALCLSVLDKMIALHQIDYKAAGLESIGKGEGYVQRQMDGWSERYRKAKTDDVGDFEQVMAWLKAKMPARDVATCIIHNDFRFDNVVLNPDDITDVIGVLDWEMATLGDPLMDLGNTLAYWVQADDDAVFQSVRRQPTHLPGMLSRAEVIAYYGEKTGYRVDNFDFYAIFGLFRLAVIVQQIYYRFFHGQTTNPAFANFGKMSLYLEQRCLRLIAGSAL